MDSESLDTPDDTLEGKVNWQRKVRNVDANLHAAFASKEREAKRKKPRLSLPGKPGPALKKPISDGPLPSGY